MGKCDTYMFRKTMYTLFQIFLNLHFQLSEHIKLNFISDLV